MNDAVFTIKAAANRSGLTPFVIRAWERRYDVVKPIRTASNQRRYTAAHVARLTKLRQIVDAGYRIGDIVTLSEDELDDLLQHIQPTKSARATVFPTPAKTAFSNDYEGSMIPAESYIQRALRCIDEMDATCLEAYLSRASISMSQVTFLEQVILPLAKEIGNRWHSGIIRISQEHMATWVIRTVLSGLLRSHRPTGNSPQMVVTTPAGQRHEIGALAVALSSAHCGWNVTYLGPDLPAEEIAATALRLQAEAVALSIVYPADDPLLPGELQRLRNLLPSSVSILIGGAAAISYQSKLKSINILRLETLADFRETLMTTQYRRKG